MQIQKLNFELKEIDVSKIRPNPNNPRGQNIRDNDNEFDYLKRSIKQFGLIVPLIVQKLKENRGEYQLLDGERRYWALRELGIKKAPVNVIEDDIDLEQAKNVMFHIHTNRVQWDPFQQCKALQPLYKELKKVYADQENEIAKELVIRTSTNKRTINDRLSFLRWPEEIKTYVYNKKPNLYWTVVEIENGIIAPATRNFPDYFKKVSIDEVRKLLFEKYVQGIIHAATEARKVKYIVRTPKERTEQHKYAATIFKKLVNEVAYTFDEASEDFAAKYPAAQTAFSISYKRMYNQISKLISFFKEFDVELLGVTKDFDKRKFTETLEDLETNLDDFKERAKDYWGD
jgi:ParB/RepB/Spo0J family partition protein